MIATWRKAAVRSVAVIVVVYLVVAAAVIAAVVDVLDTAGMDMMESTARLLTAEIGAAVDGALAATYQPGVGWRTDAVRPVLAELVAASEAVVGASLVDARGDRTVTAGDTDGAVMLRPPSEVFADDLRPRLVGRSGSMRHRAEFVVDYPLLDGGAPVGYLHLRLSSPQTQRLYRSAFAVLTVAAVLGMLVIGALAALLHLQVRTTEEKVVRRLEQLVGNGALAVSEGPPDGGAGAQPRAFDAIERVERVLADERGRAEDERRRVHRLGRALDVGVALFSDTGSLEFTSRRAVELLGADAPPDRLDALLPGLQPLLTAARETARSAEADLQHADGGLTVHATITPIHDGGRIEGFLCELRDRTELDALESDLGEAAVLRSLASLYLGVTHELKVPINAMVLTVASLAAEVAELEDPDRREFLQRRLDMMETELVKLRRSIDVILKSTAPTSREVEAFDLRETLEELSRMLEAQARQQKVRLEVELGDVPVVVAGQRLRVRHAILNLLVNALEAMPDGGTLRLALEDRGGEAAVVITDSGPGIDEAVLARLFTLHVTSKPDGTGIGLYVSRRALTASGGRLELVSTGPDGTTFEAVLPAVGPGGP